jgi:TolA-binding protein
LDSVRREQASLNAVEIAQSLLSTDSTSKKGQLDFAARKVIEAVQNYCTLFPDGQSTSQVLLNSGPVYFNRRMFENAIEQYEKIINKGPGSKDYYTALLLSAQCYFGQDKWQLASDAFKKVWKGSNDEGQTAEAVKLLLQSEFLYAKSLLTNKDYANAAIAFRHLEDQYPGSAYGDIALYNAAEAYEKQEKWILACDNYYLLATNYPYSKLAADALFNAAGNFEKADKYAKAAEAYELLISKYSQSEKAKDSLFNLGFCYEKLGKMYEIAESNEKYSSN